MELHVSAAEERDPDVVAAARRRVYQTLSRRYDTGEPSNILETHNDHQP